MAQPPSSEGLPFAQTETTVPSDYQHIDANPAEEGGLLFGGIEKAGEGAITATKFYAQIAAQQAVNDWQDQATKTLSDFKQLKGQDAMNARPEVLQKLKDAQEEGNSNLALPISQLEFGQNIRNLRARYEAEVGNHYDQQAQQWGIGVNEAAANNTAKDIQTAANQGDWASVDQLTTKLANNRVQADQLHYGKTLDPEMLRASQSKAMAESVGIQVQTLLPTNPAGAAAILERNKNALPPAEYDRLYKATEPALDKDYARSLFAPYLGGAGAGGSYRPGTPFTPKSLPAGISLNEDAMVRTVAGEAASEPLTGQRAVASVIMNRSHSSGASPRDVVFAPNQFEPWNGGAARQRLEGMDPSSSQYQAILNNVVRPVMSGQAADPTGGATHFYAPTAQAQLGRSAPSWAQGQPTVIGNHNFYKIGYGPGSAPHADIGAAPATTSPAEAAMPDESAIAQKVLTEIPPGPRQDRILADVRSNMNTIRMVTATDRDDLVHSLPDIQAAVLGGQDVDLTSVIPRIQHLLPPADAAREIEQLSVAQGAGQVFKSAQWATPDQAAQARADLAGGLGPISQMIRHRSGTPVATVGGTPEQESPMAYRLRQNVLGEFDRQMQARQQALNSDPAAYVMSNPVVQAKAAAIDANNPASAQDLWRTSLSVQQNLGVPEYQQSILTKGQATDTVRKLQSADPATSDAGAQLASIAKEAGPMWPKLYGDLVRRGNLPPQFQTLAQIPDPSVRWDFQQMLKLADEKGGMSKLHEAAGTENVRQIEQSIDSGLTDFKRTTIVPGVYSNLDGVTTVRDGVKNLASYYMLSGATATPDQAVKKATDGILNQKYDFDGTLRTPKGMIGEVQSAGAQLIGQMKPGDLAPLARDTQAVPPVTAGGPSNMPAADTAMKLTPEEKFLYQYHLDHLAGKDGGPIHQPGGQTSTLLQTSQEHDGKFYNVPTIWGGKEHTEDEAADHAEDIGWDKWPSYPTRDAAEARYGLMHGYMERDISGAEGVPVSDRQATTLEAAKQGHWVTNEDDTGAYLAGQDVQGRMHLIRRTDGSRIELKFNDLPKGGVPRISTAAPDPMSTVPMQ